jgi:hypothetical protein
MNKSLVIALSFFGLVCNAQWATANTQEIHHLLRFVETTQCKYERNGKQQNGVDAVAHIKKKYDYFEDDIDTAEDFIELSATKSTMSGKAYKVHCPDEDVITSKKWLLDELAAFRKKQ